MYILKSILLGLLSSIIASYFFWLLTFRITKTRVEFPGIIERSHSKGEYPGKNRYRIKIINSGTRDLIEVSFLVELSIKAYSKWNYTYLGLGNGNQLPIMYGKRHQKKSFDTPHSKTLTFFPIQTTSHEFQKSFYPPDLRDKALDNTLSLDDIFAKYSESFKLTIYVFGNDSLTGARRVFVSPSYTIDNIKDGSYNTPSNPNEKQYRFLGYKKYIEDSLTFVQACNIVYKKSE